MNIGLYIYDHAEVLDFSGPFEVFATATRMGSEANTFTVFLIGETGNLVTARAGYQVQPHYSIANHPPLDVLIVVGGMHDQEILKSPVLAWIAAQAQQVSWVASVCTGAFLLAHAQVLTTQTVTTHWEDIADLQAQFPALTVVSQGRWVETGKIITSGGISAGIDMSLHLVRQLHSPALALATARQMDYAWVDTASSPTR